ncbi:hypothetical protein OG604_43220 [Streptomyces sp. NBC_01231]|nr:hypothetical protein OG604_43220 [Streptomyces sp. NBC_01231]
MPSRQSLDVGGIAGALLVLPTITVAEDANEGARQVPCPLLMSQTAPRRRRAANRHPPSLLIDRAPTVRQLLLKDPR